jgi:cold shock CspA family protein
MNLSESKPQRVFGVVKEFGPVYGFVAGQDGGNTFCHWSELPLAWRPQRYRDQIAGRSVTFELQQGSNGKRWAARVFVIDEADEYLVGAEIDVADVHA